MEQPSAFEFPARQSSPLRTLSPERVNSRPSSTVGGSSSRKTSENEYESPSARATHSPSPTRKANLFADYHPKTRSSSPSKEVFGGGSGVPHSPSLPEFPMLRTHGRTNSDVQGLVKRFEHLDVRDRDAESESRRKKQEMELRRAQLGREEAESELSKWKEECRRIAEDLKESRHRESKVSNRLEKVMDDFRQAKGEYSTNSEAYVKEVRKARKEAFKSSSAVLKLQETLRDTQKRLQVSKIDHATDVQKAGRFEQEATDSKCELIAMQQEYSKLQEQYRVLEQEKEALKVNLKEEEVARIAAEGQIPLPAGRDDDEDLFDSPRKASPRKSQRSPLSDDKENVGIVTKKMAESKRLQEEVEIERRKRESAEEMVEFLRMECAFKCCDCSSASRHGRALRVSMDEIVASSIAKMKADIATILTPPASENGEDKMDVEDHMPEPEPMEPSLDTPEQKESEREVDEIMTEDCNDTPAQDDESVTLAADETPISMDEEVIQAPHPTPAHVASNDEHADTHGEAEIEVQGEHQNEDSEEPEASETNTTVTVPLKDSSPSTPPRAQHDADFDNQHPHSVRTITTTTRIPMHFTPVSKPAPVPFSEQENFRPLTDNTSDCAIDDAPSALPFDREAALAAIAYRRGRAKSIADGTMTPRKQMIEGVSINGRRDISAPVIGANGYHRKANSVSRSTGKALRT